MEPNRKTLIVFDSKRGTTRSCAALLSRRLPSPAHMLDLAIGNRADNLQQYDMVVIGTPMYMGKPMPRVMRFCRAHEAELLGKTIAIFTCGIGAAQEDRAYLRQHLPASLLNRAVALCHFGGELLLDKMNPLERMAMGAFVQQHGPAKGIDERQIDTLAEQINRMTAAC